MCSECEKYPCEYVELGRCKNRASRVIEVNETYARLCEEHIAQAELMARTAPFN